MVNTKENPYPIKKGKIETTQVNFYYGRNQALFNISLKIPEKKVTALIGPSGCGKSTFLRTLNRMNDLIDNTHITGLVHLEDQNIYHKGMDVVNLRKKIGMVFQRSNPFPKSIFDNVSYGPRLFGIKNKEELSYLVEKSLKGAALWDEVKDRLDTNGLSLSGGQQQRLCIARALAVEPEVLLMDEPASALDPKSTSKIEDLMATLREKYTLIVVTHNMQQAARVSDYTAFFYEGKLIEMDNTKQIFTQPSKKQTEDYITGRFG